MADTDTIDVTFANQKVYHDGTSMVVAKKGDTKPVERRLVPGLLADGSIKEPKGWAEEIAEKNSYAVADGGPQFSPAPDADAPPAGDESADKQAKAAKDTPPA